MVSNLQPNGLETFKKISYSRRQRGGHIERYYQQPHTSQVGSPTDWKVTGSQTLTYRSESSEPHIKLSRVVIWHWEKEPLEYLALNASGACAWKLHGTGGNRGPILNRRTQTFRALGPRAKQSLHRNLGQT